MEADTTMNTGAVGPTAATNAQRGLVQANTGLRQDIYTQGHQPNQQQIQTNLENNTLGQTGVLDPMHLQDAIQQAQATLLRNPDDIAAKADLARIQRSAAAFGVKNTDLQQGTEYQRMLAANQEAGIMPTPGTGMPYINKYNPESGQFETMPGVNPNYMNMMRTINAKIGAGGDHTIQSPLGGSMPAMSTGIRPTLFSDIGLKGPSGEIYKPSGGYTGNRNPGPAVANIRPTLNTSHTSKMSQGDVPYNGSTEVKQQMQKLQNEVNSLKGNNLKSSLIVGSQMWKNTIGWRLKKIADLKEQADSIDEAIKNRTH